MDILRIKDPNTGEWITVPALKGEKGDKGDKGEKGDKGDSGKDAVTDQTYNSESENAQSGKAVAEGIETAKDEVTQYVDNLVGDINTVLASIVDVQG